jgi:hypothetical protein
LSEAEKEVLKPSIKSSIEKQMEEMAKQDN